MKIIKYDFGNVSGGVNPYKRLLEACDSMKGISWKKLEVLETGITVGDERKEQVCSSGPYVCI